MSGLRSAPRRKIVDIWRSGSYGQTVWHHRLECGHVESRKRKAPAPDIGCRSCKSESVEAVDAWPNVYDPQVAADALEQTTRAWVSAHFGVGQEFCDVMIDFDQDKRPFVSYVVVTLVADKIRQLRGVKK